MNKSILVTVLCFIAVTSANAATITVAQDGSGMVNSVQAALATVANGDELIILDSATYNEDIVAGALAGFAPQFTLKAAEGQSPTIAATNTAAGWTPNVCPKIRGETRLSKILSITITNAITTSAYCQGTSPR